MYFRTDVLVREAVMPHPSPSALHLTSNGVYDAPYKAIAAVAAQFSPSVGLVWNG